ncbi:MAG: energy transducer TonB [Acidobacteria bacterium]|nr:energy transducer TonB [Acidobacteriota bacterium]
MIKVFNMNFLFSILFTLLLYSFVFAQESKPLIIIEQPKPELPNNYGTLDAQGTIVFRVEFLASGQIGKVFPVNSFIAPLDKNAFKAVKKIKFEPEINDGEPVTVFKVVSYFYSWNGGWKISSQNLKQTKTDEKAEAVLKKAVEKLGGEKYLQVKSIVGRGKFSLLRDNAIISFQSFVDVIVYPDKERTEFKQSGVKTVQTNTGETGWIFDGAAETIKIQNKDQIEGFKRGIRVSLDNLLRGYWRGKANLTYVGKRPASLGRRSEVVKLTFDGGFAVEFEFSDESLPIKAIYKRTNADNEEIKEEDRYAQFVDTQGIKTPYIVDHFANGQQTSRINYELIEFNKSVPDAIFNKPNSAKELKKDLKL